jgi:hypothetical protein
MTKKQSLYMFSTSAIIFEHFQSVVGWVHRYQLLRKFKSDPLFGPTVSYNKNYPSAYNVPTPLMGTKDTSWNESEDHALVGDIDSKQITKWRWFPEVITAVRK